MANKLTDMSKIRKAIKFHCSGKSKLFISNYLSLSRNTVKKHISLFDALGLNLEDIEQKTDTELEVLFSQSTLESSNPKLEKLHLIARIQIIFPSSVETFIFFFVNSTIYL